MCPMRGGEDSLPRIVAGTSSRTINTIQLMSKGVSSTSPCEPVTCLVQPRRPGASRPATTQGHVSSRCQQPRKPQGRWANPKPSALKGTLLCTHPGHLRPSPVAHGRSRVAVPVPAGGKPYRSHLRGGGYREGAEPCWLATMAVEERPAEGEAASEAGQPRMGIQLCQESWKAPDSVKAKLGTRAHAAQRWLQLFPSSLEPSLRPRLSASVRFNSYLLHRAGCTAPAAASTRGGGGGGALRAGAEMVRCGAGRCSSLPRQLPRRCYSSRCLPPLRSHCGPAPETSSRLSGEEKADAR